MKTYTIACFWTMMGNVEIEANSLNEAIEMAYDTPIPRHIRYVYNTFQVNHDCTRELNRE